MAADAGHVTEAHRYAFPRGCVGERTVGLAALLIEHLQVTADPLRAKV